MERLFYGERKSISLGIFKAALKKVGAHFGTGFLQRPSYMYEIFRNPNAYGNKGCPYNCHLYKGKVEWKEGLCPVAEDVIPRIVHTNNMVSVEQAAKTAEALKEDIKLTESGNVEPLDYIEIDKKILEVVKNYGPLEPMEVINIFNEKGWEHFDEYTMPTLMEDLRDRFPYKLSHAGPRKFTYHELK